MEMEHPSKLEKNLDGLLVEMGVLTNLREEMERRGEQEMDSWLQKLEGIESEVGDIQKELSVLKTGFHSNMFKARLSLNKKVIGILKSVEVLKEQKAVEVLNEPKAVKLSEKDRTDDADSVESFITEQERGKPQRYSYEKLTQSYQLSDSIGGGGFGDVYRAKIDGTEVAIKVLRDNAGDVAEKQFMAEVRSVFNTSHRHLVKLLGYCFHAELKALVYEYMVNGSFDKILYMSDKIPLTTGPSVIWETLYNVAIGTGKGIAYLHEGCDVPMIHFDIKAANVLLDSKGSPKVTDFGLAKTYKKDTNHVSQSKSGGTLGYAAPEVCVGRRVLTYKCDVYSYGMMLFEVLRRKQISMDEDWYPGQVWECFANGQVDRLITNCGIEKNNKEKAMTLIMVALWCTQVNPENRPSMSTVVKVLLGEMHLSPPINPDPSNFLSSASSPSHEIPPSLPSAAVSPAFKERLHVESFREMEESSNQKKFASTSNLRTPVYLQENTIVIDSAKSTPDIMSTRHSELKNRSKVSVSSNPESSTERELTEKSEMQERKIDDMFPESGEAIPIAGIPNPRSSKKDRDSEAMLEKFEIRCPPGGENSVIAYTSTNPYGKPLQDTNRVLLHLHGEKIHFEKRDIHAESRNVNELKRVLGKKNIQVPVVFVKGRLIGGADELDKMNDNGELGTLFHGIPKKYREEEGGGEEQDQPNIFSLYEIQKNRSVQSEKETTHTEKSSNFPRSTKTIPSIQKELKMTLKNVSNIPESRKSKKERDSEAMLEKFELRCPPGGENSVIVYTSSKPLGKPLQDTNKVLLLVHGEKIHYEKRDIHADSRYANELKRVLGRKNIQVPVVFVKGRLIGGVDVLDKMNNNGDLKTLFRDIPKRYHNEDDKERDNKEEDEEVQKWPKETFKNMSYLPKSRTSKKERDSEAMLEKFEIRCPPGGENSVIAYTTTSPYGKPLQDTNRVLLHLHEEKIHFEKRDIHADSRYVFELKKVLGKKHIQVPVVFVKGRLIGGADELEMMNDNGDLETLFHGIPKKYDKGDDEEEEESEEGEEDYNEDSD